MPIATTALALDTANSPAPVPPFAVDLTDRFTMLPNEILDLSLLDPYELSIYSHLWRLTRGFHVFSKQISINRICERTLIGRTKVKEVLGSLEEKKLIKIEEIPWRTNKYSVFAPREVMSLPESTTALESATEHVLTAPMPIQSAVSQDATIPGRLAPTLKDTFAKDQDLKHTLVCPESFTDPTLSAGDLAGTPLAGLPQKSLEWAAKAMGSVWAVIQVIFSILISYSSEKMAVLNPVAIFKWAIKNKNKTFVMSEIKEVVSFLLERISWIRVEKIAMGLEKFNGNEFMEIKFFEDYLRGYSFEYEEFYTLDKIFEYYNNVCKELKRKKFTIWSILAYRKPVY